MNYDRHKTTLLVVIAISFFFNATTYSQEKELQQARDAQNQFHQNDAMNVLMNGGGGVFTGFCFEQGITCFNATITRVSSNGPFYDTKYVRCFFASIHTIATIKFSDNVFLKGGIGAQMRFLESDDGGINNSHTYLDPSFYLKLDTRLYRALYITVGGQLIWDDAFHPIYKEKHNESIWSWDCLPQLGLGYVFGVATFEFVYKHGINNPSHGIFGDQYITLRLLLQWNNNGLN